ncbi:hypothetical protein A2954_01150 [Candidatus Roizmanbacteria bacterium RIFCSPLOWO2_01_FULL_37_12]|uniref:Uncharacterized protein n=1 Tax=Candidatus Roizmanbacteria bacterium RIFCSPLOWO2_01_FULL_37_12 TaxID=1802056 RepID=A0A1F7IGE1_9BACT|nr:MAG: hypothetical protein A3D76_01700 [Candidatus Roizmanbacteria bacterium RIFCSPHIGHO2_02_FULL_37_9b]OGK42432.1 MAG: hypothetical protein A2954_01150 [Candidatus Roizmanbacteria bacterium RIFCSPLOWO2_01_FULL_37_12]
MVTPEQSFSEKPKKLVREIAQCAVKRGGPLEALDILEEATTAIEKIGKGINTDLFIEALVGVAEAALPQLEGESLPKRKYQKTDKNPPTLSA